MTSPATYRCTACGTALDRAADRHWIGGNIDNMGPDAATRDVNPTSAVLTAVDGAAVPA